MDAVVVTFSALIVFAAVLFCYTWAQNRAGAHPTAKPMLPMKERLGRKTWRFLHTFAEALPNLPSADDYHYILALLNALSFAYPCVECRAHFQQYMCEHPVPTNMGKQGIMLWIFDFHNSVNARLGKPLMSRAEYLSRSAASSIDCAGCTVTIGELPPPYR